MGSSRDFKGIWIPASLWRDKRLNVTEKFLILEIDSLDNGVGCFASSQFLGEHLQLSSGRVDNILTDLRKRGIIETIKRDRKTGKRWLRVSPSFLKPSNERNRSHLTNKTDGTSRNSEHSNTEEKDSLFSYENKRLKVDSKLYQGASKIYNDFHLRETGNSGRFDAGNGLALKKALKFIGDQVKAKNPDLDKNGMRQTILDSWEMILSENCWSSQDQWIKNKTDLRQINSNLTEIMNVYKAKHKSKADEKPSISTLSDYNNI
jgi:hypothetical protein